MTHTHQTTDNAYESGLKRREEGADSSDRRAETPTAGRSADTGSRRTMSPPRLALAFGLAAVLALASVAGWFGLHAYQTREAADQTSLFLQVARQGAINLTTIDWEHVDADVQRILDTATGTFYDDFSKRAQPFAEVVKQAQSKSVGSVIEAGLESESGNEAEVLIAVKVTTTNAGVAEQAPRAWRMRVSVQRSSGEVKVSNVQFVP